MLSQVASDDINMRVKERGAKSIRKRMAGTGKNESRCNDEVTKERERVRG